MESNNNWVHFNLWLKVFYLLVPRYRLTRNKIEATAILKRKRKKKNKRTDRMACTFLYWICGNIANIAICVVCCLNRLIDTSLSELAWSWQQFSRNLLPFCFKCSKTWMVQSLCIQLLFSIDSLYKAAIVFMGSWRVIELKVLFIINNAFALYSFHIFIHQMHMGKQFECNASY